jgi:CheY-like chemotaxis protein
VIPSRASTAPCDLRSRAGAAGGNIPAIAITAYARPEDRAATIEAGFQDDLAKPVEPAVLIERVSALAARATAGPPAAPAG